MERFWSFKALGLCFGCILLCLSGSADDWPAPQVRAFFSASGGYFVRVIPGSSWGDTIGFAGAPKGLHAKAEFYRREPDESYKQVRVVHLVNPVAPVDCFVADRGIVATLDNWHNRGYGKIVALYAPDGSLIRAYELSELFSPQEIEAFSHSVSSIQWHDNELFLQPDQKELYVGLVHPGSGCMFDLKTGSYRCCEQQGKEYRCRNSNRDRQWVPYSEKK